MKIIKNFNLDFSALPENGETRQFTISGDVGAVFSLWIQNEDNYYYNFQTRSFQVAYTALKNQTLQNGIYNGDIKFPSITDDDHYNIYLYADPVTTRHADYKEVRFTDSTLDLNNSTGSNSLMLQKKIYQYTDVALVISVISPNSLAGFGSLTVNTDTITVPRYKAVGKVPFKITTTSHANRSFRINRQPTVSDLGAYVERTVGSSPVEITTEEMYPAASNTDTVDGDFTAGSATKIVMDTNVASKMAVGDKITAATSSDTADGGTSNSNRVVMDNTLNENLSIGDEVTGPGLSGADGAIVTVTEINPDSDNAKEIELSTAVTIVDGSTLTFSPKCNRSLTTVSALNPDGDNVKEFSMSQAVGFKDGVTLTFSNQKNYRWPINNITGLISGMMVKSGETNVAEDMTISGYSEVTIVNENEINETVYEIESVSPIIPTGTPTLTGGIITAQAGDVVFNQQLPLVFAGDSIKIWGYGEDSINSLFRSKIKITDLKAVYLPTKTTTTASTVGSASATVAVAEQGGIMDDVSTISGVGIKGNPLVTNKAAATGAGNLTVNLKQELESGAVLTFNGASKQVVLTGILEIEEMGNKSFTIYFDLEKFLTAA